MFLADSQVHIWGPNTPERPWLRKPITHRDAPLTTDQLLKDMDAAGVSRAVLIPPGFDGPREVVGFTPRYVCHSCRGVEPTEVLGPRASV
jgi:predicted TIM-barrel fold metal-dependent hydrolase